MFLDLIRRRNPKLIEDAIALHQLGKLPANCYVVDLDALEANSRCILTEANGFGLKVFAMTKQIGRNDACSRAIARGGILKAVAVDMNCARSTYDAGLALGHIGHLVQVPRFEADAAATMSPDYWTVFSLDKAREAGEANLRAGRSQPILARLVGDGDRFYRGHEGGFRAGEILDVADRIDKTPGAHFAGVTTFPAQLFDREAGCVKPTPNFQTLRQAALALRQAGRSDVEVNAPGTTSSQILPLLAEAGATQIEPGHGLTGTTPLHVVKDLPETPAVIYLSEVSHLHNDEAFCFGGGLYVDPILPDYPLQAIVTDTPDVQDTALAHVVIPPPTSIDYYGMIEATGARKPRTGDSVVFGFRPQAFITRAYVAGVSGIRSGSPIVESITDALGRPTLWPL